MPEITAARLREVLDYNPDTGVFTWLRTTGRAKAGAIAGTPNGNGYLKIRVDGVLYFAHRLAWLYVHGEYPTRLVDHRDRNRARNAIENLRIATPSENTCNRVSPKLAGLKGASFLPKLGVWKAQIKLHGRNKHLGHYETEELAHEMYCLAADMIHGDFANHA